VSVTVMVVKVPGRRIVPCTALTPVKPVPALLRSKKPVPQ